MKKYIFNGTAEIIEALQKNLISFETALEEMTQFSVKSLAWLILNPHKTQENENLNFPKHLGTRTTFNVFKDIYCRPDVNEKTYISKHNEGKVIVVFVNKQGEKTEWVKDLVSVSKTDEEYINEFNRQLNAL